MQVAQGHLHGRRLPSLPEKPVPVSHHPHGNAFFLLSDWEFPWFGLCPILLLCIAGKSLALSDPYLPTRLPAPSLRSPAAFSQCWNPSGEMGLSFRLLGVEQSTEVVTNYFSSVWLKQLSGDFPTSCVAFLNHSSSH